MSCLNRLFCTIVLVAVFQAPAFALAPAESAINVTARLVKVDGAQPLASTTAALYGVRPTSLDVATDGSYPHAGSVVDFAGSGPQAEITGADLYLYSTEAQAVNAIQYRVMLWETYSAAASPVFQKGVPVELVVNMVGPFNLEANAGYMASVTLPKSILVEGYQAKGVSVHVLGDYGDGQYLSSSLLVPTMTGNAPLVGSSSRDFGAQSLPADDPDFDNFNAADMITQRPAITLYGNPLRLSNCSTWNGNFGDFMIEEFDPSYGDRWALTGNDGSYTVNNGIVDLFGGNTSYPYGIAKIPMLPANGDFSVSWTVKYKQTGPAGDGFAIATAPPVDGQGYNAASLVAQSWQDNAGAYRVDASVDSTTPLVQAYSEPAGTALHDVEYCWLQNSIELWVDGALKYQHARNANVARPAYLWFGNPAVTGGGFGWNNFELHRVQVRTPLVDNIFRSGFESIP